MPSWGWQWHWESKWGASIAIARLSWWNNSVHEIWSTTWWWVYFWLINSDLWKIKIEICISDLIAYEFDCSSKHEVHHEGCTTMYLLSKGYWTTCYCTGDKCTPPNPTSAICYNSANNIGAQVTIAFAVCLTFFNKIMAWMIGPLFSNNAFKFGFQAMKRRISF